MIDEQPASALPPPDVTRTALAHAMRVLDRRLPGLMDDWVESLDDDAVAVNLFRLRPHRDQMAAEAATLGALNWARTIRLFWFANIGAKRARRGKT